MSSYLDFDGVYDKSARYLVFNWSAEDFIQHFGAESVYNDTKIVVTNPAYDLTIKAGEMRELGQFEAYTCTKHFVNREMIRDAENLVGKERERLEMAMNNKDARKPYEEKTLQKIEAGVESPFMSKLRDEIRKEEADKLGIEVKVPEVATKKFCEYCDSKGVAHKKDCTRPKSTEFAGL